MGIKENEAEKYTALLHEVKFFKPFGVQDVRHLLDAGNVYHYKLHEYIFKEEETDYSFFVILKGAVKLLKQGAMSQKKELAIMRAGECFGEMGLLLHDKRTATALAAEASYVFKITSENVDNLPTDTKGMLYHQFAVFLAERLKETTQSIISPDHF
ncbi:hypothetical protein MNBD_NITROSPINAE01-25 [hydrothermal vent metagenome]|uniref:Cyclic nucleotide-binding domain-containing protein n=1 Tax=hydrothermal vent metagenome TaxID=652676 RepID=A0A3B1CB34_9ZZZZ